MRKLRNSTKYTGIITDLDLKTTSGKITYGILTLILCIVTLICVVPLLWAILSGFKEVQEFYSSVSTSFFPKKFVISNLTDLFSKYHIEKYALNSVFLIVGTLVVEIVFTATGGYVLSKIKPIGGKILFTVILWTMMMPTTLSMVPLFMTFIDFPILHINFMNSYIPMWLMAGANCFHILLFKDFFDGIPTSYFEAAKIDGAGSLQIFYRIILPLSKPIVATVSIFAIKAAWDQFLWPLLLLKKDAIKPLALVLYELSDAMRAPQQLLFAVLITIPMVIVYYIGQYFIVNNSNSEGEKG